MKIKNLSILSLALGSLFILQNSATASYGINANNAFQFNEYPVIFDPSSTPQLTDPASTAVDALIYDPILENDF